MRRLSLLALVGLLWLALSQLAPGLLPGGSAGGDSDALLHQAYEQRQGNLQVTTPGVVARLLPDDTQGSRHQRFIVRLASGQTLLIAHNIDLAPRVAGLQPGDTVTVSGEYEWNDRGGVIHWTHHDPEGRHPGGWIEHRGRRYE